MRKSNFGSDTINKVTVPTQERGIKCSLQYLYAKKKKKKMLDPGQGAQLAQTRRPNKPTKSISRVG